MADKYYKMNDDFGSINISDDVIINIIINTITDIEGVAGLANTAGAELAELVGLKTIPKGVKVTFDEDKISADVIITVKYGFNILKIAEDVQECVVAALQSKVGIMNPSVNIHVSGISF